MLVIVGCCICGFGLLCEFICCCLWLVYWFGLGCFLICLTLLVFVKGSCSYGDCVFVVPYVRIWCLVLGVCCLVVLVGLSLLFWFAWFGYLLIAGYCLFSVSRFRITIVWLVCLSLIYLIWVLYRLCIVVVLLMVFLLLFVSDRFLGFCY